MDGVNRERDYCIICLFLNCGLRISEIVGLNVGDIRPDNLRILGKGNKERIVYLNEACIAAIEAYRPVPFKDGGQFRASLFVSNRRHRMDRQTVHAMVKRTLLKAGLPGEVFISQAEAHCGYAYAAKRRGCAHGTGGSGPRAT